MKSREAQKSYLRPAIIIAALSVVVVLHFFFTQFVALQSERDAVVSEMINQPAAVESETVDEAKYDVEAKTQPGAAVSSSAVIKAKSPGEEGGAKIIGAREFSSTPALRQQPLKKKESPATGSEARNHRLRRAEKILTGI